MCVCVCVCVRVLRCHTHQSPTVYLIGSLVTAGAESPAKDNWSSVRDEGKRPSLHGGGVLTFPRAYLSVAHVARVLHCRLPDILCLGSRQT